MRKQFCILICLFFLSACDSVFFYPTRDAVMNPEEIGLQYDAVKIDDGQGPKLYGWFIPAQGEAKGTILHLHGNAENISTHFASVYWFPQQGFNLFTFDYRGYGISEGTPTLEGVHVDAIRAAKFIRNFSKAKKPLILLGQSLGASIAINTAANVETCGMFKAVVVESPFATYRGIAREKLSRFWLTSIFKYPLAWTISSGFDPVAVISNISPTPILIIHPNRDQIVPLSESEFLFEKAKQPKEFWRISDRKHIQTFSDPDNRRRLILYFQSL